MRRIATLILALALVTCGCQQQPPFYGKCTIEKIDGKVVSVKLMMPNKHGNQQQAEFNCTTREEMDKLIEGLEGIVLDLKVARDQMPVIEPKK